MIHYTHCPVCDHTEFKVSLKAKDHTVSGEEFSILQCQNCNFLFTQDIPDQHEIGRYYESENYVSHTDTKKNLFFRLYAQVRNITLQQKLQLINRLSAPTKEIMDVGSGTGYFPAYMQKAGWMIKALEPSSTAREVCLRQHGIQAEDPQAIYTMSPESVSVITLWHVMEHVHDLNSYFSRFFSILKPGGFLVIAVPNPESYDAKSFGAEWAAWDVPRHLYHFTPATMKRLAEKHGFSLIQTSPMWFDALYVSMLSKEIQNRSKWSGLLNGLASNLHALTNKSQTSSLIYIIQKPKAK